jgi:hypothetical protein
MLAECTLTYSWTGPVDMVRREGGATRASIFLSLEQEMALFLLVPSTAVLVVFLRWPVPVRSRQGRQSVRGALAFERLTKQCVGARELFVPALARELGVVMVGRLVFSQFCRPLFFRSLF